MDYEFQYSSAMALSRGWVVVSIPEGESVILSQDTRI